MHYVYIIQSEKDGSFYKGYSENPLLRLQNHNEGKSTYTAKKCTWNLVALFAFETKTEALQKEKKLKKYNSNSLNALIISNRNILKEYLNNIENR
jgi:putative endonuclease